MLMQYAQSNPINRKSQKYIIANLKKKASAPTPRIHRATSTQLALHTHIPTSRNRQLANPKLYSILCASRAPACTTNTIILSKKLGNKPCTSHNNNLTSIRIRTQSQSNQLRTSINMQPTSNTQTHTSHHNTSNTPGTHPQLAHYTHMINCITFSSTRPRPGHILTNWYNTLPEIGAPYTKQAFLLHHIALPRRTSQTSPSAPSLFLYLPKPRYQRTK